MPRAPEASPSSAGFELLISRIDQMMAMMIKMMALLMNPFTGSSPSDASKIRRHV